MNPLGSSVIPLTVNCHTSSEGGILLTLTIDAHGLYFRPDGENVRADLEIAIADFVPGGRVEPRFKTIAMPVPRSRLDEVRASGFTVRQQWELAPGATSLRIVVRDMHTDQWGSVDVALNKL